MGFLSRKDNATLLAYLNNGADGMLAEEARRELAARGMLPEWAAAPSAPDNVESNLAASSAPIDNDPVLERGMQRGVRGPQRDDGGRPAAAPEFSTQGEADRYYTRTKDPVTGRMLPSPADEAMAARGFVPVYGAEDNIAYQMGYPATSETVDGGVRVGRPASAGASRELWHYRTHAVTDPKTGGDVPAWEMRSVEGPTGTMEVLAPTDANRRYNAQRSEDASVGRIASRTGKTREDIAAMSPRERANLMQDAYLAEQKERRDRVSRRAMMVGGSENLNPVTRSRFGTLEALGDPGMNDWQKLVLAETMLREPQRMTPLGAEAVGASNAMRMMNADIFAQGLPGAMDARQRAKDAERLQELRAVAGQAYRIASPSMRRDAVEAALIGEGASAEERAAVMNDLPGLGGPMPGATPPPGDSTLPNGAPQARWPVGPR